MKKDGNVAVFVGVGMPAPKVESLFASLTPAEGFYTSKNFLPAVSLASKGGMCVGGSCGTTKTAIADSVPALPALYGRVVVLGAGDTAMDCATSALRCGASRVYIAFRRGFNDIRAVPEEVQFVYLYQIYIFVMFFF